MRFASMVGACFALLCAVPGQAALFTLTGGGNSFSFSIADSPTPDVWYQGVSFVIYDVPAPSSSGFVDVTFYNKDWFDQDHRSLQIEDYYADLSLYELFGTQLYTGPESAPTFAYGSYELRDARGATYNLTIGSEAAGVPEPASWAMMIAGFGLAGAGIRRTRRSSRALSLS